MLEIVLSVLVALTSLALIVVVLMQSDKEAGLGALAGNADTFMNKNGDAKSKLAAATKWLVGLWLLCVLCLSFV